MPQVPLGGQFNAITNDAGEVVGVASTSRSVEPSYFVRGTRDAAGATTLDEASADAVNGPRSLKSGVWTTVPAWCQVVLTGTGAYTYDTGVVAGDGSITATLGEGSGNAPDVVPIYMGGATKLRFNFPQTAAAKVN